MDSRAAPANESSVVTHTASSQHLQWLKWAEAGRTMSSVSTGNCALESMSRWHTHVPIHVPHRRWRSSVLSWPRRRRRKWRKWAGSGERWASHITNQTAATSRTCRQGRGGWKEGHRRRVDCRPGAERLAKSWT